MSTIKIQAFFGKRKAPTMDVKQPTPHVLTIFSDSFCCFLKQAVLTPVLIHNMQMVWGRVVHLGESCSSLSVSSTKAFSQASVNDIGLIIKTNMDIDSIHNVIVAMSKTQKHELIFNHQLLPLTFPSTFSHGCNRRNCLTVLYLPPYRYNVCFLIH